MSRSRRVGLAGIALLGLAAVGLWPTGAARAATAGAAPAAPVSVTLTQPGPSPDLQVTWVPAASGTPPTGATVQLYLDTNNGATYVTQIVCAGNCTSAIFRELASGTPIKRWCGPTTPPATAPRPPRRPSP